MRLLYRNSLLVAVFIVVVAAFAYYEHYPGPPRAEEQGQAARPDFDLNDLMTGERVSAAEWDGKIVLYNFWAAWCPPCRREIPVFNEVRDLYQEEGFEVVGIAVDGRAPVVKFLEELGNIAYPQLIQSDVSSGMRVMRGFGNDHGGLPYSVLVDRRGVMRHQIKGEFHKGDLLKKLDELLNED